MSSITSRAFQAEDLADCLQIFDSNVPKYFREHERPGFESFLSPSKFPYFVAFCDDEMVGCAGYAINPKTKGADLCWGMVAQSHHGKHFGEFLLLLRLQAICRDRRVESVRLGTSQLTDGFFQKYGFEILEQKKDAFAEGLDHVEMRLAMTDKIRSQIIEGWERWTF